MPLPLLNETRTWTGHWWLPENPDEKVPGVLTYEPGERLMLRLIGGWNYQIKSPANPDGSMTIYQGMKDWPVVHGIAEGKRLSLLGVHSTNAKSFGFNWDRPDQLHVIARTALVWRHLGGEDDAEFVSSTATIENLTAWSRASPLQIEMKWEEREEGKGLKSDGGQIRYQHVESPKADLGEVTAQLHSLVTLPTFDQTRGATTARVVERTSVEFSSETPRPLREWLDMLSGMSDLMSLVTLSACTEITLHVYGPATPDAYPADHPQANMLNEVEVYERRIVTPEPDREGADLRSFLMTLEDLSFADLMPQWVRVKDQFESARSMILGLRYITDGYLETRVVTAVGAAEAFHRALESDPPMTATEFKALRKSVLAAVPAERKEWMAGVLARNEPSLRDRLTHLARRPGEFMVKLVPDPDTWAIKAARARNGLAHAGQTDAEFEELHAVVEVTAAVVILNLLAELGIPPERLEKALDEQPLLSVAVRLAKEYFGPKAEGAAPVLVAT